MFGALLGGLTGGGLGAIGIGALIGGLGAKQRGGNFLKGALSGAALGGIAGGVGQKLGGAGGLFGWGAKSKWGNLLPAAGILMGSEMMGQQEANRNALEARRRLFEEEEDERIARLSRIAGYDVADSRNFLTPQSYFGAARGGMMSRPGYYPGGIASIEDDPMDAINVQEMQMDPGTMGPGELVEEFDFMEEAGSGGDESGWYEMFFNEFGRDPVNIEELQLFIDQSDISDTDVAGVGQGPMMAAEGGIMGNPDIIEESETYDEELVMAKGGGIGDLDLRGGGHSIGPGTGTSDDIPAMLSDGEFVVTAKAVENLGGGDRMEGARRMYSMMNQLDPQSQSPGEMNYAGRG
jgi:hypothetical protein